jgi:dipeptidyl aminopeptidase/acylaminoacyl peptidase
MSQLISLRARAHAVASGLAVVWLIATSHALAAPPPAAFGQLPNVSLVDMNPAGTLLAFTETVGDSPPQLVIFDIATKKEIRKVNIGTDFKVRDVNWADSETVLLDVSRVRYITTDGKPKMYVYQRTLALDATGGPIRPLLLIGAEDDQVTGATLVRRQGSKPKTVMMSTWEFMGSVGQVAMDTKIDRGRADDKWVYNLFEVDTTTGKGKRVDAGSQFTTDWIANKKGASAVRAEWNPDTKSFRILGRQGLGWKDLHRQTTGERMWVVGLSADESAVLAVGARGGAKDKLWSFPLTGAPPTVLAEHPTLPVEALTFDPLTDLVVAAEFGGTDGGGVWIDSQAQARFKSVAKAFAGKRYRLLARSEDQKRVLVRVWGPSAPPMYYLVDFAARSADIVGEEYPKLADVAFGEVKAFSYKARDGYDIPAYLTLPAGSNGKNLPLVVLPHGGPESRDEDGDFDWWAQFLASRGYAVLQPQFRGSTGFGEAHRLAGRRQWGKLMQDDVTDGAKAMVAQGVADPKRMCVVGWSYGGYVALAGAAFTPELYACAASINGISDLPAMLGADKKSYGEESNNYEYWNDHVGSPTDPDVIAKSPSRHAAAVRASVLLVHSVEDTIVRVEQSDMMERALRSEGKAVEFLRMDGDDHNLAKSVSRVRMLTELEAFLGKHLGIAD